MKEVIFCKRDGHLRLVGRSVDEYRAFEAAARDGEYFRARLTSLSASKSQEQLGYYYGVVIPDVMDGMRELGLEEVGYEVLAGARVPLAINMQNVDRYLKVLYAGSRGIDETVRKARMSKAEMSDFLTFVLGWAHEYGIAVRPADVG